MDSFPTPPENTRIGFHYFPDTIHYREDDLIAWLPELRALGASWLVLEASPERAIPEFFLSSLIKAQIEPVIHMRFTLDPIPSLADSRLLFETYAHWGVHYVILFDQPNAYRSWPAAAWLQSNLVERFLDAYLPLALLALNCGLIPVFPPLEPGGDYWDTAFLIASLHGIIRREGNEVIDRLVLGAYARAGNRALNWGIGGPQRWPEALPYYTPTGTQDQRGFRIFDWYLSQAKAVTGAAARILLLQGGCALGDQTDPALPGADASVHCQHNLEIAAKLARTSSDSSLEAIPPDVLACNYWLLAAEAQDPSVSQAWFQPSGAVLPIVEPWKTWAASNLPQRNPRPNCPPPWAQSVGHPIAHYLLLPVYEWGVADWHVEAVRPLLKETRATLGFSLQEAALAAHVTVLGGALFYPDEVLESLRAAGCTVERLVDAKGTELATDP